MIKQNILKCCALIINQKRLLAISSGWFIKDYRYDIFGTL